jgi:hypothetical protein
MREEIKRPGNRRARSQIPVDAIPGLVTRLYRLVRQLEQLLPRRRFTPDGHLVGSIGDVVAARRYALQLLPHSSRGHDAKTTEGTLVEIKTTPSQEESNAMRASLCSRLALVREATAD